MPVGSVKQFPQSHTAFAKSNECSMQKCLSLTLLCVSVIVFSLSATTPLFGKHSFSILMVSSSSTLLSTLFVMHTFCNCAPRKVLPRVRQAPLAAEPPPAVKKLFPSHPEKKELVFVQGSSWDLVALKRNQTNILSGSNCIPRPIADEEFLTRNAEQLSAHKVHLLTSKPPKEVLNLKDYKNIIESYSPLDPAWKLRNAMLYILYFAPSEIARLRTRFFEGIAPTFQASYARNITYLRRCGPAIGQEVDAAFFKNVSKEPLKLGQLVAINHSSGKPTWAMVVSVCSATCYCRTSYQNSEFQFVPLTHVINLDTSELSVQNFDPSLDVSHLAPENEVLGMKDLFDLSLISSGITKEEQEWIEHPFPIFWGREEAISPEQILGLSIDHLVVGSDHVEKMNAWVKERALSMKVMSREELRQYSFKTFPNKSHVLETPLASGKLLADFKGSHNVTSRRHRMLATPVTSSKEPLGSIDEAGEG